MPNCYVYCRFPWGFTDAFPFMRMSNIPGRRLDKELANLIRVETAAKADLSEKLKVLRPESDEWFATASVALGWCEPGQHAWQGNQNSFVVAKTSTIEEAGDIAIALHNSRRPRGGHMGEPPNDVEHHEYNGSAWFGVIDGSEISRADIFLCEADLKELENDAVNLEEYYSRTYVSVEPYRSIIPGEPVRLSATRATPLTEAMRFFLLASKFIAIMNGKPVVDQATQAISGLTEDPVNDPPVQADRRPANVPDDEWELAKASGIKNLTGFVPKSEATTGFSNAVEFYNDDSDQDRIVKDLSTLKEFLGNHPSVRWTKPYSQRLLVNTADFKKAEKKEKATRDDNRKDDPSEIADRATQIRQGKTHS